MGWMERISSRNSKIAGKITGKDKKKEDNYKTSACLNFFMDKKTKEPKDIGLPSLHFDYLGDNLSTLNNKNAIFIDSDKRFNNKELKGKHNPILNKYFDTVTELEPIIIKINNKQSRKFWIFYCTNYQYKK